MKNLPEYYEHGNYEDGYRGIQGMAQGIISSYGAYHIVEGASPTIAGTQWTGTAAYGMMSGAVKLLVAASGIMSATTGYLIYNVAGTFAVTGAKPTGIILAKKIGSTVYTAIRRQDVNSKEYFPNDTYHYGNIYTYGDIYGNLGDISGYDKISADSGYFSVLGGFSDITMRDSIDFDGIYHLKGVSQLTGAIISGSEFTGTAGLFVSAKITNIVADMDFGGSFKPTSLASGDANGEPIRYDEYQPTEANYYTTSGVIADYPAVSGDYVATSGDYVVTSGGYAAHKANNGSDHSFINQAVKTTSSPTFGDVTAVAINAVGDLKVDDARTDGNQEIAIISSGTYDGDGDTNRFIDAGFDVRQLSIFMVGANRSFFKTITMDTNAVFKPDGAAILQACYFADEGFYVYPSGENDELNTVGQTYHWVAIG